MDKMYTTQLTGLFKKINETQVESFEDAGRLLAQALSADGTLYVKAFDPFGALELAVTAGSEPLPHSTILDNQQLTSRDRVLLFLSDTSENQALALLELCQRSQTPTIVVASKQMDSIADACDVLLVTHATKGLVPDDKGNRIGHPGTIAALFLYNQLHLLVQDILTEFED
ncbi:LOW QUALITY PROTEIN: hypothetical protein JCM19046_1293 [Bacillus sp. JCM 19046]|uniref:DNA-binding MurR/RpiR family transcriptional regulator n=2 Tax=Shouchella xiaoxiensis TaxID=766895 RepID=A0ABS2SYL0_9BACI|nr:DNA-binding MurR/RpiR family transcriptional regulator [Shouchella xiaoxiensis]GAF16830.1 LOW QUALITY PROTEIN: hypothetical protein JCM19046_1293 [Bacillus sp. JCM 19046]